MFHTGMDLYLGEKVYVLRTVQEKKVQQLFFFLYKEEKRKELKSELKKIRRIDLIERLNL
jgi:hypothetical protein